MKALVMSEPGNVKMTELPMPEIKSDEVLVRVRAAGICINDVENVIILIRVSVDMSLRVRSMKLVRK